MTYDRVAKPLVSPGGGLPLLSPFFRLVGRRNAHEIGGALMALAVGVSMCSIASWLALCRPSTRRRFIKERTRQRLGAKACVLVDGRVKRGHDGDFAFSRSKSQLTL
jgi:hypothetical protein